MVQGLGLHALTAEHLGLISVRKLGPSKPYGAVKKKKKKKTEKKIHPKGIFFYMKAIISSRRDWLWKVE